MARCTVHPRGRRKHGLHFTSSVLEVRGKVVEGKFAPEESNPANLEEVAQIEEEIVLVRRAFSHLGGQPQHEASSFIDRPRLGKGKKVQLSQSSLQARLG
jgi:hypothetical protein